MCTLKPSWLRFARFATLASALVACSSSAGDGGASTSGAAGGTCKTYDPCAILPQASVGGAIGADVGAGVLSDNSKGAVELKECNWTSTVASPKRRSNLLLRCYAPGDNDPPTAKKTLQGIYKNVVDVPGLGDTAIWASGLIGLNTATTSGQLDVFVGKSIYFIVDVSGMPDDASALAAATKLAQDVLPKL
jgi:hypothetical protein